MLQKGKVLAKKYEEVIAYLIVGVITTIISLVSYYLFSRIAKCDYQTATILSWILSVLFAFFANKIVVFKSKTNDHKAFLIELFNFFKYRILSLVIDMASMFCLIELLHINDMISKIIVQFIIVVANYVFSKFLIFNQKKKEHLLCLDKKDYSCIVVVAIVLFSLFGIFLHDHFAMDTMFLYDNGYLGNAQIYLQNTRPIMYLFLVLLDYFKISFRLAKILSWFIGYGSILMGIIVLYDILKKFTKNKWLNILTSFLVVANILIVEFFSFPEFTGIMCLSLLAGIISSKYVVSFFDTNNKKYLLKALAYSILSMFSYQGTMAFVLILPLLFTLHYSSNIISFIKRNMVVAFNYLVPCILGLIYANITGVERTSGSIYLSKSLMAIYTQLKLLIAKTVGVLPTFWYFTLIIVVGIILLILILKTENKKKIPLLLFLIYISLAIIIVPAAPFILVATDYIDVCSRSALAYGSIVGFLSIFYIVNLKVNYSFEKIIMIIAIIVIAISNYNYQEIAISRFIINNGDKNEAQSILKIVETYEENNNIKVNKISFANDMYKTWVYTGAKYINNMTTRGMTVDWANISYLNYYGKDKFKVITNNEDNISYCANHDWDHFDLDQMVFVNDTLYLCLY